MKKHLAAAAAATIVLTGCSAPSDALVVGAGDDPRARTIAALYVRALRSEGFDAQLAVGLGESAELIDAVARGEVDIVPQCVGQLLTTLNPQVAADTARGVDADGEPLVLTSQRHDVEGPDFTPEQMAFVTRDAAVAAVPPVFDVGHVGHAQMCDRGELGLPENHVPFFRTGAMNQAQLNALSIALGVPTDVDIDEIVTSSGGDTARIVALSDGFLSDRGY